jgi:hypothetical protein
MVYYDASETLKSVGGESWEYKVMNMKAHPSQFQPQEELTRTFRSIPPKYKRVYLLELEHFDSTDRRYYVCK